MSRRLSKKTLSIIALVIILVVCGVLVSFMLIKPTAAPPQPTAPSGDSSTTDAEEPLGLKTTMLTDKSQIKTYKASLDNKIIKERYIHTVPKVDWKKQDLLAIQYSLFVARSVQKVDVVYLKDGATAKIVIEAKDPPTGCSSAQVNETNVSFVALRKDVVDYSVVLKSIPNKNKCPQ